jgi:hypothetical protein
MCAKKSASKASSILTIDECPRAFINFAHKHNMLVGLVRGIKGRGGINVTVADYNLVIEGNQWLQAVTSDGTLFRAIIHSFPPQGTPASFPTHLQTGPDVSNNRTIMEPQEVGWSKADLSSYAILSTDGLAMVKPGLSLSLSLSALTHSMSIRTIDVCDSGTPKSMDILGSAPY